MENQIDDNLIEQITKQVQANIDDKNHDVEKDYLVMANTFQPLEKYAAPASAQTLYLNADINSAHIEQMLNLLSAQEAPNVASLLPWGRAWFAKLKIKIKKAFCSSDAIRNFFTGGTVLKTLITKVLPIIITAIGISAINPLILAALIAIITALIKAGYDAVCPTTN